MIRVFRVNTLGFMMGFSGAVTGYDSSLPQRVGVSRQHGSRRDLAEEG